ncbi:MAG TPA: YetF domain-containing protein [Tepidisphaeraceae bacterium]|nr:YetF domain-containing protein [Tepidisphaeraceae bacterium]
MSRIFFDNWQALLRTGLIGVLAYICLVILLRVSGKRTLSKMNAFDFIVTIALGSTLASVLISKDVSLAQGVLAFSLLIFMQYAVTWLSVRVKWVRQAVKGEPTLLVHKGQFLDAAMKRTRVTEDEIRAAVRSQGVAVMDQVLAVVLETDGTFSIVKQTDSSGGSSLVGVQSPDSVHLGTIESG